jgi:S1-C subfamily serine protease
VVGRFLSGVACFAVCLWAAGAGAAAAEPASRAEFTDALRIATESPSVVVVTTRAAKCPTDPHLVVSDRTFRNTGFFVGTTGQVITSLPAVAGCSDVRVSGRDGRSAQAQVVAFDQAAGLALLDTPLKDTVPLKLPEGKARQGDLLVLVSARPEKEGLGVFVQPGIVLPRRGKMQFNGVIWPDMILTAMYVQPGTAGAPVLDAQGRLRGIVLAAQTTQPTFPAAARCYVLPTERLTRIITTLGKGKSRRLGWLGLAIQPEPDDRRGVTVASILRDSPADKAGLRPGDVLMKVGEGIVKDAGAFSRLVVLSVPGSALEVQYFRGDPTVRTAKLTVGARPLLIAEASRRPGQPDVTVGGPTRADLLRENARLRAENARLRKLQGK